MMCVKKVLFVCRGNIGRSQMAEALLRSLSHEYEVVSAGTKLSGPEQPIGELSPATDNVIATMKELGIDMSSAIRKNLTPQMINDADVVIATVDSDDPLPEYLAKSNKALFWNISDPKGKSLDETRSIRDTISNLIKTHFTR